eukprot:3895242-Amphidinium_carterae.1
MDHRKQFGSRAAQGSAEHAHAGSRPVSRSPRLVAGHCVSNVPSRGSATRALEIAENKCAREAAIEALRDD